MRAHEQRSSAGALGNVCRISGLTSMIHMLHCTGEKRRPVYGGVHSKISQLEVKKSKESALLGSASEISL